MIQLNIDIITELKNMLPSSYNLIVPSIVIDELESLKHKGKGKNKLAANIAYKIACNKPFNIVNLKKNGYVDNTLLDFCKSSDVLCTNDQKLRKRARSKGISVIFLRQHMYLEIDGIINY